MRGSILDVSNCGNEYLQISAQCHQPQAAAVLASLAAISLTTKINENIFPLIEKMVLSDIISANDNSEYQLWRRAFYTAFKIRDNILTPKERSSLAPLAVKDINSFFDYQSMLSPSLIVKGLGMQTLQGILDPLLKNLPNDHLSSIGNKKAIPPKYIGSLREVRNWSSKNRISIALPTKGASSHKQNLFLNIFKSLLSPHDLPIKYGSKGRIINPSLFKQKFSIDLRQMSDCGLLLLRVEDNFSSIQNIIDSFFSLEKYDTTLSNCSPSSITMKRAQHSKTSIQSCLDEYNNIFYGVQDDEMDAISFGDELSTFLSSNKPFFVVEGNLDDLPSINDFVFK